MNKNISFSVLEEKGKIVEISLNKKEKKNKREKKENNIEKACRRQINEYFLGRRKKFDVKIKFSGTLFQEKVWKEIQKISYGKTLSYKEIAARIGKPKAYRAVANACGKNSLPIIIPCHRVVASDGIGGYSAGVEIKKKLLELENK